MMKSRCEMDLGIGLSEVIFLKETDTARKQVFVSFLKLYPVLYNILLNSLPLAF